MWEVISERRRKVFTNHSYPTLEHGFCVATKDGIVSVCATGKTLVFSFVFDGHYHKKTIRGSASRRFTVTLARRFAGDVANETNGKTGV